ncbi:hypothetical protein [Sphingomonas sp. J315]|uniref:hypothetical protein n=1 Tax=Sphingomonas sp. J315 TaxID=2898433 RepID=UPI0021AE0EC2|nr:hypothetical protein [Sphingomonas sp. J315]UUX98140.1 hypothetical protein LRS08_10980 [Sphingomonas sp. J315]
MRKLLIPILLATAPAAAQIRDPAGSNAGWPAPRPALPGVARELDQVDRSIRDARDAEELSRREARELRRESRRIAALEERYARDGLSESERAGLQARIAALRSVASARAKP